MSDEARAFEKALTLLEEAKSMSGRTQEMATNAYKKYHEAFTLLGDLLESSSLNVDYKNLIKEIYAEFLPIMEEMRKIALTPKSIKAPTNARSFLNRLNRINAAAAGATLSAAVSGGAGVTNVNVMPVAPSWMPHGELPNISHLSGFLKLRFERLIAIAKENTLYAFWLFMKDVIPTLPRSELKIRVEVLFDSFNKEALKPNNFTKAIDVVNQILYILDHDYRKLGTTMDALDKKFLNVVSGGDTNMDRRLKKLKFGGPWKGGKRKTQSQHSQHSQQSQQSQTKKKGKLSRRRYSIKS
jgi:hypothetical protein